MFLCERAVARPSAAKCIDEAKCFVELGIFLGGLRNGTIERCKRLAPYCAIRMWPYGWWFGSQTYELVERRCSMRCGHATRQRAALGHERTPQALNQEIEKSDAIGPSVDINEAGQGGAFHGTMDLGKAHRKRSSQLRVCWPSLRRGKRELHRDDDVLWPHRHRFIIVSHFAKCKTYVDTGGVVRAIR